MDKTNIEYVLPEEIEKRSFAIIAAELAERGVVLPAREGNHVASGAGYDHQTGDPYQCGF